jgi:predicted dehydrogenase
LLTVFHQRRWYANQRIVEQVVREGKLGKIVLVRLSLPLDGQERRPLGAGEAQSLGVSAKFEERFAVFVGFDMLVHHVDQLSRLVGEQPKRLQARASYRNGEDLPWDWEIHLDYPSGVLGIVEMIHSPLPHPKWVISGTDGSLVMDFANDWSPTKVRYREAGGWVGKEIPQTYELGESFKIVYRKMRDAIRTNGPVPVEPKDARGAVAILWKALESSRTGSPQELDI